MIGGGYAGMSAAVSLCDAGFTPIVFEASATLGGRARRVVHEGQALDNGLHILIGAYRETLGMLQRVMSPQPVPLLRLPLELTVHGQFTLRTLRMPAPLNVLHGLTCARGLSWGDKWAIARMMATLRIRGAAVEPDVALDEYLTRQRQTARARRLLWEPLCIAALNTLLTEASTRTFTAVLRDTFASPASNSDLLLPTVDFSRLFPEPAAACVEQHGGEIRMGERVLAVRDEGGGARLALHDSEQAFDAAIIAVAPQHVGALARHEPGLAAALADIAGFTYRPIHSIYLAYDQDVRLPRPMLGLAARHAHWVFDRGQLGGAPGLLGVVTSADGAHEDLAQSDLAEAVHRELTTVLPHLPPPRWHRVIAERRATIASTVGLRRPTARTACARIFLAGDYVETEYPATLEAAVRSGTRAAAMAAEALSSA